MHLSPDHQPREEEDDDKEHGYDDNSRHGVALSFHDVEPVLLNDRQNAADLYHTLTRSIEGGVGESLLHIAGGPLDISSFIKETGK